MSAVVFNNFSYAYEGVDKVLDNISLVILKGSFTVLTGPNGAGKTTLCLAVCGAVPHYYGGSVAGEVKVAGTGTMASSMNQLAEYVGIVLEDYESQLVTMTVEEEIAFALESRSIDHGTIKERIERSLELVGLAGMEKREVASLSGGQKQRLAIASVLATKPSILVLDEPASALDPEGAEGLYALLGKLNSEYGITIVVVEHDLAKVLPYATQLVIMAEGKIAQAGSAEHVLQFMEQQEDMLDMIPEMWKVKIDLEQELNTCFGAWRSEADAIEELAKFLTSEPEEDYKSA
jgi:energy-coupling factor transport system ATP-binding protein